jgi:hypothetical protein
MKIIKLWSKLFFSKIFNFQHKCVSFCYFHDFLTLASWTRSLHCSLVVLYLSWKNFGCSASCLHNSRTLSSSSLCKFSPDSLKCTFEKKSCSHFIVKTRPNSFRLIVFSSRRDPLKCNSRLCWRLFCPHSQLNTFDCFPMKTFCVKECFFIWLDLALFCPCLHYDR